MTDFKAGALAPDPNVANAPKRRVTEATRIPMSLPTMKLAVPEVPGFFLYWHRGADVPKALNAGYEFVKDDELDVEQKGVANPAGLSGSTDMGTNISILAGGTVSAADLRPERLYLMKLPNEWREKDEIAREAVNEQTAAALRGGQLGQEGEANASDRTRRFLKQGQDLFYPKPKR